jgi:hypothetical protein
MIAVNESDKGLDRKVDSAMLKAGHQNRVGLVVEASIYSLAGNR